MSHHNAANQPPWAGHDFAIIRITWGVEGVDAVALEHLKRAKAAGCELVVYQYLKDQAGDAQCDHFLHHAAALEPTFGALGHMVDIENMPHPHPPFDAVAYQKACAGFVGRHRAVAGRRLIVYGNPADLKKYAVAKDIAACPLMVAHWNVVKPYVPPPWTDWTIWQHAVTGGVDRNVFRGSREDWRRLLLPDGGPAYEVLGGVVTATRGAMGIGDSVETFVSRDEGPVIG